VVAPTKLVIKMQLVRKLEEWFLSLTEAVLETTGFGGLGADEQFGKQALIRISDIIRNSCRYLILSQ
jgi:hypothetical protein